MPNDVTLDPPITNIERLLAKAAGMEGVSVDDPETRIERYLKAICDRLDSGGVLVVTEDETGTGTLNKTWQEIHDAGYSVLAVESQYGHIFYPQCEVYSKPDEDDYGVSYWDYDDAESFSYRADAPNFPPQRY